MPPIPHYEDLPTHNGERVAWGVFGTDDRIGSVNFQTPQRVRAAAQLIRKGSVFSLNLPWVSTPGLFGRTTPVHRIFDRSGGRSLDDVLDGFYPQAGSQWDSLAHVPAFPGSFYNDTTVSEVRQGRGCTVEHLARRGIAGRGVVLDIGHLLLGEDSGYCPDMRLAVTVDHLEAAREAACLDIEPGDILLLRTGWLGWYLSLDPGARAALAQSGDFSAVGLARSERIARYLWDHQVSAVATDAPALEAWPACPEDDELDFLHTTLIGRLGLLLGELWWLDDLVDDCRRDSRFTAFVTSAPCPIDRGIGSPANALAIT